MHYYNKGNPSKIPYMKLDPPNVVGKVDEFFGLQLVGCVLVPWTGKPL